MVLEPEQKVALWRVVRSCSAEDHRVARAWLLYTLLYWMFPTIIVGFGFSVAKKQVKWLDLVIHGEFLVYAITIVAGSTRLVANDVPSRVPFVTQEALNFTSDVIVFPAMMTYGLLRYLDLTEGAANTSAPIVVTCSISLLVVALAFSYLASLVEGQRAKPERLLGRAADAIARAPDILAADFDRLQQGSDA